MVHFLLCSLKHVLGRALLHLGHLSELNLFSRFNAPLTSPVVGTEWGLNKGLSMNECMLVWEVGTHDFLGPFQPQDFMLPCTERALLLPALTSAFSSSYRSWF